MFYMRCLITGLRLTFDYLLTVLKNKNLLNDRVIKTITRDCIEWRSPSYFRQWPGMIDIIHPYFFIGIVYQQ